MGCLHSCLLIGASPGLRPGGLLSMAVDCSSFTFPNVSNHKRQHGQEEGADYYAAILGNCMAMGALGKLL